VIGILLALQARPRTGGQYVDVAMLDGMVSTMSSNYMTYLGSQQVPRPMGTAFTTIVPYRVFAARDRAVSIAVGSEKLWRSFCDALDQPDWKEHPDYATNARRIMNRATLEPAIEHVMSQQPADYWIARLHTAGIPAAVVSNFQDVVASPQAAIRQLFPTLDHPTAGPHQVTGTPVKLSATPGRPGRPAPLLGQHSTQVLRDLLGLEEAEIDRLAEHGILFDAKME
jgi:crotonobetainyl-CoA:carnitine CoA-transferase CaiB-like acyl-CoA transferase